MSGPTSIELQRQINKLKDELCSLKRAYRKQVNNLNEELGSLNKKY